MNFRRKFWFQDSPWSVKMLWYTWNNDLLPSLCSWCCIWSWEWYRLWCPEMWLWVCCPCKIPKDNTLILSLWAASPASFLLCTLSFPRPLQGDTCRTGKNFLVFTSQLALEMNYEVDRKCQVTAGTCSALIWFPRAIVISFLHYHISFLYWSWIICCRCL